MATTPLVPDEEMYSFIGEDDASDPNPVILPMRNAAEAWVRSYCDREFTVASYKERYNGDGSNQLVLRQSPVTQITRLSLWPAYCIRVCNRLKTTNATVSCFADSLILTKDYVDTTLLFVTYPTYGELCDAINALGNGWEAAMVSDTFRPFLSTELFERMGLYCLEGNWVYLMMPYQRGELDFDIDAERGVVHLYRYGLAHDEDLGVPKRELIGFPRGTRNIFITYKAGYVTIPDDLKLVVKIIVKFLLQKKEEESWGTSSQSVGEVSFSFDGTKDIPWEAKAILDLKYRKYHF